MICVLPSITMIVGNVLFSCLRWRFSLSSDMHEADYRIHVHLGRTVFMICSVATLQMLTTGVTVLVVTTPW